MESFIGKLHDGGVLISYPIVIILFVIIALFIRGFLNPATQAKAKELMASLGWFVLAWGYLGRTFGLIEAFDNIAAAGDITPSLMAGGLKMALIGPLLGLFTFAVARIGIIIYILMNKNGVKD